MKLQPLLMLISAMVVSGCMGIDGTGSDYEDRIVGKAVTGEDIGDGYLEEYESESVFNLDLEENQFLTHITFILNWDDEPEVNRGVPYINEGDQFTLRVTDGRYINSMSSATNSPRTEGRAVLHLEGDVVDNQSRTGGATFTVEITLTFAGDQYPLYYRTDALRVDDTGNEFRWRVEYRYVDKNL